MMTPSTMTVIRGEKPQQEGGDIGAIGLGGTEVILNSRPPRHKCEHEDGCQLKEWNDADCGERVALARSRSPPER